MRVVITGMGVVSPVGCSVPDFWRSICAGVSGVRPITRFNTEGFTCTRAGEVTGFTCPAPLQTDFQHADLSAQFMAAAVHEAMQDAQIPRGVHSETGLVLSTNFGGVGAAERFFGWIHGQRDATPTDFRELSFQWCADRIASFWGLNGPRAVLSLSCASGTAALGYGFELVRSGQAEVVVAGGYDALTRYAWSGLSALRTIVKDEIRPFDRNRAGTIFGEGAGALVVESYDRAQQRGATLYAEILGYGLNNNAFHMTAPAKEGAGTAEVMRMALSDAGLGPGDIEHINAHGTGTKYNDVTETQAIKAVFGAHAQSIPITAIKSMITHTMGAAGSMEAIASVLTMRDGVIPPTTNFREADPECDLDYVLNVKRERPVRTVLSNSAGIGGCNAAVVMCRTS